MTHRGSNHDYGFECEECGRHVMGRERNRLAARRYPRTLCAACLDRSDGEAYAAKVVARRTEEGARASAEIRDLACAACGRGFQKRVRGRHPAPKYCGVPCHAKAARRRALDRLPTDAPGRRYSGPPRPGYVYRLRDAYGRLLYVGKTYSVHARLFGGPSSHSKTKHWWGDVASIEVAAYRTEADALEAERWVIQRESPLHNIDRPRPHTGRSPACLHRYVGAA